MTGTEQQSFDVEVQLERQASLQRILMETALHFINLPIDQLDQGIGDVLSHVGQFTQVDRTYLLEYDFVNALIHNTYEWCAPGISPEIDNLQNVPMALVPYWIETHCQKKLLYIPEVGALPAEDPLQAILEAQGIKSLITIPLISGEDCLGSIGFDAVRENRPLSDSDITLLKFLAELIVNAKHRLRHEKMLKQAAEELQLSESRLRSALAHEKELGELKSRFVAMVSHELRTPLATILAAAETLLAYGDRLDLAQMQRRLHKICERVGHLQAMIGDVLQLARIEAKTQEVEMVPMDLAAFCFALVEEYKERTALDHHWIYQATVAPIRVCLDPQLFRQALDNLLENAIKYSAPGTSIELSVAVEEGSAQVVVVDHGIGIPAGGLAHLFEPFHRAANATMIPGTGLGMPITREIVLRHRGTIAVESEVGVGTTVRMTLPLLEED
jgi:signal transduction histidine kinase